MAADPVVQSFLRLVERFRLSDVEIGAVLGTSVPTARVLRHGIVSARTRGAVEAFVARASGLKRRTDLTLADVSRGAT